MYVIQFLKQHAISFLPVYIFSGESVTEVCNIIKKKPIDNYAIVFGDEAVYRLLCNIYSIERVCFISSNSSIITVKRSIQRFLKIKERQSFHEVTMTKLESLVLSFLVEGKTPYQASREFELSVQSISRHKRNAMLKLGVRTTTELFLKYALLIAQREE
jgi:DNA-binding CsgD family transcriptional regulator